MIDIKLKGFSNSKFLDSIKVLFVKDNDLYYPIKGISEYSHMFNKAWTKDNMKMTNETTIINAEQVENIDEIREYFKPKEKPTQKLQENIAGMISHALNNMTIEDISDMINFLLELVNELKQKRYYKEQKEKQEIERATVKDNKEENFEEESKSKTDKKNTYNDKFKYSVNTEELRKLNNPLLNMLARLCEEVKVD